MKGMVHGVVKNVIALCMRRLVLEEKNGDELIIPCNEATFEQREKVNIDDCECEEWDDVEFSKYWYPQMEQEFFSIGPMKYDEGQYFERNEETMVLYGDETNWDNEYEDWETWDNFDDTLGDEIIEFHSYEQEELVTYINQSLYAKGNWADNKPELNEQDNKQTSLFPLGQWVFPSRLWQ